MTVGFLPMKSRTSLTCDVFDTFVTGPGLVYDMTSLIQTTGHKMAALTVVFLRLSNVEF